MDNRRAGGVVDERSANGAEWLTAALPRSIADIEAFMARAPKELRISALEMPWQKSEILSLTVVALNARRNLRIDLD